MCGIICHVKAEKTQNLAYELASQLRGAMPVGDLAYVCAEIAFVLARMGSKFIAREDEFVDLVKMPIKTALEKVLSNEIKDAKTCYALLRYCYENGI